MEEFYQAYVKNNCRLVSTCEQLGYNRNSVMLWRQSYPEFENRMQKARDILNEKVEGTLINEALNDEKPNMLAKIFYLKNNWREKYADHQTLEVEPSRLWFDTPKKVEIEQEEPKLELSGNL